MGAIVVLAALAVCACERDEPAGVRETSAVPANFPGSPAQRDSLYAAAKELSDGGLVRDAIATLNDAIDAGPEDARCRLLLGLCRSRDRNDVEGARRELLRAAELAPDEPEAAVLLARMALELGEMEEAGRWTARALAVDGGNLDARVLSAILDVRAGRLETALATLTALGSEFPDSIAGLTERGCLLLRLGRFDEAAIDLERAIVLDPTSMRARFNLANALHRAGHAERAAEAFQDFQLLNPVFSTSRNDLEPDAARREKLLWRVCDRFPDLWQARLLLARTQAEFRGAQVAAGTLRDAIQRFPDVAELRILLAVVTAPPGRKNP